MQISFLNTVSYDPNSDDVIVPVVVDDKLARCNVTRECLDQKFHAGPQPNRKTVSLLTEGIGSRFNERLSGN